MDDAASPHQVLVGVDGSDGARTAMAWDLQEAQLRGGAVRLVTVWPEDRPPHARGEGIGRPDIADVEEDVRSRMRTEAAEVAASTGARPSRSIRRCGTGSRPGS